MCVRFYVRTLSLFSSLPFIRSPSPKIRSLTLCSLQITIFPFFLIKASITCQTLFSRVPIGDIHHLPLFIENKIFLFETKSLQIERERKKHENKNLMEESLTEHGKSLAAPLIFVLVLSFHVVAKYLNSGKDQKGSESEDEIKLRAEIKQLLKEANSLSQPSTFAQAAKLKRMAAAKEKELAKYQEMHKGAKSLVGSIDRILMIAKVVTYGALIIWFWQIPVSSVSDQLVQPFGRFLSWRAGKTLKDNVMVGIIPWLIASTRVSKFICRKMLN